MSALEVYNKRLPNDDRAAVAQRAVSLAGYPSGTAFGDVIDHEDHVALVEALREWWQLNCYESSFLCARQDSSTSGDPT